MEKSGALIPPLPKKPGWEPCLSVLRFLPRILLGIFAAGLVGISIVVCRFASEFELPSFQANNFQGLAEGLACASVVGIVAMLPGIVILLILDQCSERFRQARLRPLYAGLIGVAVFMGWCLFLLGWGLVHGMPMRWNIITIPVVFPIACFLSGATFATIVTFPRLGKRQTSPR